MKGLVGRGIDLAVAHAGAGAHDLNLSRADLRMVAKAVAMLDRPLEDVTENLHVPVRVHGKANPGRDDILVDDPEGTKAHVRGVMVVGEAEGMPGTQPAVVGVASFPGAADGQIHPRRMPD